jgi:hypothetical protein
MLVAGVFLMSSGVWRGRETAGEHASFVLREGNPCCGRSWLSESGLQRALKVVLEKEISQCECVVCWRDQAQGMSGQKCNKGLKK